MSAVAEAPLPIQMTDAAANKVKNLITEEENPELKLRVYITGGGCSGFQYGFTFDEKINDGDTVVEKNGVTMVIDPMSLQYLVGGSVDYTEGLEGSRFHRDQPQCHHDLWLWLQLLHLIGVIGLMKRLSATRAVFVCGAQ